MSARRIITGFGGLALGSGLAAAIKAAGGTWVEAGLSGSYVVLGAVILAERGARLASMRALSQAQERLAIEADALGEGLEAVHARLGQITQTFEVSASQRDARLVREMKVIEGLVSRLAPAAKGVGADVAGAGGQPDAKEPTGQAPQPNNGLSHGHPLAELTEMELLEVIRSALEDNRIDLYLQPIVSLPQRKTKLYEGLARLRSLDGDVIEPEQFMGVAERAGLMPVIDNLLLFRCVQIVRRLLRRHAKRAVFCNMSSHSLEDPEFFPQFLEFMTENKQLAKSLLFEFSHRTIEGCSATAEANLEQLAALGFHFSLDQVAHLRLDFSWLRRRGFRYVKVQTKLLTGQEQEAGSEVDAENFLTLVGRNGLTAIAERVETETDVLGVLEHDLELGQGFLFGAPRPIRRDALDDIEDAEAA